MAECTGITYKSLIERGFFRIKINDEVFFDQRGYHYFIVTKEFKLSNIEFQFDESQLIVKMYLIKDDGHILDTKIISDLNTLDSILNDVDSIEKILGFCNKKLTELFKQ